LVIGVAILFVRGLTPGRGYSRSTQLGILLLLPFMILWGAAVAGRISLYPQPPHHLSSPFAVAAVSALLASIVGQKLWRGLLIAALLMGVSTVFGDSPAASINTKAKGGPS